MPPQAGPRRGQSAGRAARTPLRGAQPDQPLEYDLTEGIELLRRLATAGVAAVNLSCGSPYYNPHIQRPAIFPPSDGYQRQLFPLVVQIRK